jgi:dTMP kinase
MIEEYNSEILNGFIVFEGLDGSGTTTQADLLIKTLDKENANASLFTCEPTTSFIGKAVRQVLEGKTRVAPGVLARLFAVDRRNHLYHPDEGIVSLISRGKTVICDRYLFSSLAYQSVERPFEEVWELNRFFPLPEHLIFLDISPEEGNKRLESRGNPREVYERRELQEEIRENYFHVFSVYGSSQMQIHVFDASLGREELAQAIRKRLNYN